MFRAEGQGSSRVEVAADGLEDRREAPDEVPATGHEQVDDISQTDLRLLAIERIVNHRLLRLA